MRLLGRLVFIGALVVLTAGGVTNQIEAADSSDADKTGAENPKMHKWHSSFEEARKASKQLGLPLLIHFHATWCGACQHMEEMVLNTSPILSQLGKRVIAVKIDTDHEPELSSKYYVGGLPHDVFLAPDGHVLSLDGGAGDIAGFRTQIIEVSNRYVASKLRRSQLLKLRGFKLAHKTESGETKKIKIHVGLKGFSPVAITADRKWRKGSGEFALEHDGIVYHMSSADELERFKAEPTRYVPGWLGHDPLALVSKQDSVAGDIRFGVFFHDRLYLLSSNENRKSFLADPGAYEDVGS